MEERFVPWQDTPAEQIKLVADNLRPWGDAPIVPGAVGWFSDTRQGDVEGREVVNLDKR